MLISHNGRKNRVRIFLNSQIIIVYTCKPHINHQYSLVIITLPIAISKLLYFLISAVEKDCD